jgi:hypothetical protein
MSRFLKSGKFAKNTAVTVAILFANTASALSGPPAQPPIEAPAACFLTGTCILSDQAAHPIDSAIWCSV